MNTEFLWGRCNRFGDGGAGCTTLELQRNVTELVTKGQNSKDVSSNPSPLFGGYACTFYAIYTLLYIMKQGD